MLSITGGDVTLWRHKFHDYWLQAVVSDLEILISIRVLTTECLFMKFDPFPGQVLSRDIHNSVLKLATRASGSRRVWQELDSEQKTDWLKGYQLIWFNLLLEQSIEILRLHSALHWWYDGLDRNRSLASHRVLLVEDGSFCPPIGPFDFPALTGLEYLSTFDRLKGKFTWDSEEDML